MRKPILPIRCPGQAACVPRKLLRLILAALLLSWPMPKLAQAAAGDLDASFANGGKLTTDFGNSGGDGASAIAIQGDGKIVVAGVANQNTGSGFALARYNRDGGLDLSFGTGGKVTTTIRTLSSQSNALAIQGDGKIVLAGTTGTDFEHGASDFAMARFNTDGSLDTSFGTAGKVITDFLGSYDTAYAIAIQRNGKIVAAGAAQGEGIFFALARYNSDGSLDVSFGSGGKVITDFQGRLDQALVYALSIQKDGKIVAAGRADDISSNFGLARYNRDGSLDATFGSGGKVTTDFNGLNDEGHGLAIQTDGKLVVVGTANDNNVFVGPDFALARYNPDGSLDNSFGAGGKVITDFNSPFEGANAVAIQADSRIVVAGDANLGFALARYNPDGSLNASFGTAGKLTTPFNRFCGGAAAAAIAIQSDRKIVAAGGAFNCGTGFDFALARYAAFTPRINGASIRGKKLFVSGEEFDNGAVILINGEAQNTINDGENPDTILISKKGGKKIGAGETVTLQVRNSDGTLSPEFRFTRPTG
jgi:uncharacterized delta-60 repeat protein